MAAAANETLAGAEGVPLVIYDAQTWPTWLFPVWVGAIIAGLELLNFLILQMEPFFASIPVRAKKLEVLSTKDWAFIVFNKLTTPLLSYQLLNYAFTSGEALVPLLPGQLTLLNTVVAFAALFVVYDFFYTLFHRALHLRSIYWMVHKHHHRNAVPFRSNLDAVNVHPFEFVVGEWLHLIALYLVNYFLVPVHAYTILVFIVSGGIMASLNHTRFDVMVDGVFQVRYHDIHHRVPDKNFGQYIMLWDKVFGSFRPYEYDDVKSE